MTEPILSSETWVALVFKGDELDPLPLIQHLQLPHSRPRHKGLPFGSRQLPAKTSYISFYSHPLVSSKDLNDHVAFMLDRIDPKPEPIRKALTAAGARWKLVIFEGSLVGQRISDLRPDLIARAAYLELPIAAEDQESQGLHDG